MIILVSAMLFVAMAGEASAYVPPGGVSVRPVTGTLSGYVKTSNGDAVSGAKVTVYDSIGDTQIGSPVTSDSNGHYSMNLISGSYTVAASRSDVGSCIIVPFSISVGVTTSKDLIIHSLPHMIYLIPAKGTITANGVDTVAITIRLADAFEKTPGDTGWGWVNVKLGDASPIMIDPGMFFNGETTVTYGPLPPTTTATTANISLNTTGSLPSQITNVLILNVAKPAASPSPSPPPTPTPTSGPSPSAQSPTPTPPAASPSLAANTPTAEASPAVSQEPANGTMAASNDTGPVQPPAAGTSTGNESTYIFIIGGLLVVIALMVGVGGTYFLMQKKK